MSVTDLKEIYVIRVQDITFTQVMLTFQGLFQEMAFNFSFSAFQNASATLCYY